MVEKGLAEQKIVAIGGGELGRPNKEKGGFYPVETTLIDKKIIALSGKNSPKILFIPTASSDSAGYVEVVKKHFGERLGCKVDALLLKKQKYTKKEIEEKIFSSDIIYVGGGNTLKMIKLWKKLRVNKILENAREKGIVLSGLSAGAICWFSLGNSDSRKFKNPKADYIKVSGLGMIKALLCPHYNVGPTYISKNQDRRSSLKRMMRVTPGVAIALENCSALEVVGNKARLIVSKPSACGYKIFWSKGMYHKEKLIKNKWLLVSDLVKKLK